MSKTTIVAKINDYEARSIVKSQLSIYPLNHHHIESFNEFVNRGVTQIVTKQFKAEGTLQNTRFKTGEDLKFSFFTYSVQFKNVEVKKPTDEYSSGGDKPMLPNMARENNCDYVGDVNVDAEITINAYGANNVLLDTKKATVKNYQITKLPIMVGSKKCHTYGRTRTDLIGCKEDPTDLRGYFILGGKEWSVDVTESRTFNYPNIFRNIGYEKEVCRGEFISKFGNNYENSSEIKFILYTTGEIGINLVSSNIMKDLRMPFYLIFRLLGIRNDKEIFENIAYGYRDPEDKISVRMTKKLLAAMKANYNYMKTNLTCPHIYEFDRLKELIVSQALIMNPPKKSDKQSEETLRAYYESELMNNFDKHFLPHIGSTRDKRLLKARYFGYLINRLLLVEMQIISSTDRDSLATKRLKATGESFAKLFKTSFNMIVIKDIKSNIKKLLQNETFNSSMNISSIFKHLDSGKMLKIFINGIASGTGKVRIGKRVFNNRLQSQRLTRKNPLNVIAIQLTVRTNNPNVGGERRKQVRYVHNTYNGFYDPGQSSDNGESVGINKGRAITAIITGTGGSIIDYILLNDTDLIVPINHVRSYEIHEYGYNHVFVNGVIIGFTKHTADLVDKYRELRRMGKIHKHVTIFWDVESNDVYFWNDVGRLVRPLFIVRNNLPVPESLQKIYKKEKIEYPVPPGKYDCDKLDTGFHQAVMMSSSQVESFHKNTVDFVDLEKTGVIEWISAEEQTNCVVASCFSDLYKRAHDPTFIYTHVAVDISNFSIPILSSPHFHFTQSTRTTYEGNQIRQTNGMYILTYPYRYDKGNFVQWIIQEPLTPTFANDYFVPCGQNTIMALMTYGGYNQEDSLLANQASLDRGMFNGCYTHLYERKLEGETIGTPDKNHTTDYKDGDYSKLVNGKVPKGTIIKKGDVLVGVYSEHRKQRGKEIYKDTSEVYKKEEDAVVINSTKSHSSSHAQFYKVMLYSTRSPIVGDKFSSRHGQKGVIGMTYRSSTMPLTAHGVSPDFILNPHAIPTRMTMSVMNEMALGKIAAHYGIKIDTTVFDDFHAENVNKKLVEIGEDEYGTEIMFNGNTGMWMDEPINIGPQYYQRLMKFVLSEYYATSNSNTYALTHQPVEGKGSNGGLRIGEMETTCFLGHSMCLSLLSKFTHDSDKFTMYICANCGKQAIVKKDVLSNCPRCKDYTDVRKIDTAWCSKLMLQELEAMNISIRLSVTPFAFEE